MPETLAPKAKVKASPPEPKAEETGLRPRSQTAVATKAKATVASKKGIESDTESNSSSTRPPSASVATTAQSVDEAKGFLNRYFEEKLEALKEADIEGLERFLYDTLNKIGAVQSSLKRPTKLSFEGKASAKESVHTICDGIRTNTAIPIRTATKTRSRNPTTSQV